MTATNITDCPEYLLEQAKQNYQHNLTSLHDIRAFLQQKVTNARNPESIFFDAGQINTLCDWIDTVAEELSADYVTMNRLNRRIVTSNNVLRQLSKGRTPKLQDLLKTA